MNVLKAMATWKYCNDHRKYFIEMTFYVVDYHDANKNLNNWFRSTGVHPRFLVGFVLLEL